MVLSPEITFSKSTKSDLEAIGITWAEEFSGADRCRSAPERGASLSTEGATSAQNMPFSWAACSGMVCMTSQCSTIRPFPSSRNMSIAA